MQSDRYFTDMHIKPEVHEELEDGECSDSCTRHTFLQCAGR